MFFRNLTLFRFSPAVAADLDRLDQAVSDHALRACGPLELFTRGFVPPILSAEHAALTFDVADFTAFSVGGEDRMLPAAVVNDELQRRVQKIAEQEVRRVGGRERRRMREDLLNELLPRAFVRCSRLAGYLDRSEGWLVLETASRKAAEGALTQLREVLGSFPAVPLAPEESPRVLLTDWLANGNLPACFQLGDECELRDPSSCSGAIIRARRQEMDSEEIKEHLRNGKQVFRLGLVFDQRISFVLGEDLVVRKLRPLDLILDQLADQLDDTGNEATARFAWMTLELRQLLGKLDECFGLSRPADV